MANYTIIGSDGKEYGPVSAEELRKWIAGGRADARTKVRAEGGTEWVTVAEVPELHGAPKPANPPPLPANMPGGSGKTSVLAILSLVFGILGVFTCGSTALIGLILGIIALVKVGNSRGELQGKGLALAGTIVSGLFLLMLPIWAAMLLPALAAAKAKAQLITCVNNEKQLALAVRIYEGDNKHFPPAATWCDAIQSDVGNEKVFKCPAANAASRCDYAYNDKLDGMDADKVDPQTVMIFEADNGWNAHGGPELLSPRHRMRTAVVALADGSVRAVPQAEWKSLRWDP